MKFSDLKLDKALLDAIHEMGFEEPSPIQAQSIPIILQGRDVVGQAQTGTGKTAAFGIPLIQEIEANSDVQALILTPTRELAIQVAGELNKIARYKRLKALPIYGGQSIVHQIKALKQHVQIVVGTPGRILDHLKRKTLKLKNVRFFVLDEADEMLDMGFIDDIEEVIKYLPADRQTLLFSATMPPEIKALTRNYMRKPEYITVTRGELTVPQTKQVYFKVLEANKTEGLCRVLDSESIELGMIFCRTKKGVDQLTDELQERGYLARGLHGDLNQQQRDQVMKAFREHAIELLVATDVAARGIDVGNVTHVINYDIPQDPESYVHRIGRTGRAGKSGIAMTFVTPREMKLLRSIETQIKTKIEPKELPTIEDIEENLQKTWMNQISQAIQGDDDVAFYAEMVSQLQKQYPVEQIAAVALKMLFQRRVQQDFDDYDFGETGAAPGMVRLFINLGHNAQLTPKDFIQLIADEADIPKKSIGKISIFDRFSFVEVPESDAPFVLESIQHVSVNGHRLYVAPAHPRNAKKAE